MTIDGNDSSRPPWWQRSRGEQLVAASVAIALNAAGVWFLARHTGSDLPAEVEEDHVIQLVFLEREPEPVSALEQLPAATTKQARLRPTLAQPSKLTATELQPAADPNSSGDPASTAGRPLNLSVPDAPISFARNPVARQEAPIATAPSRMQLVFTDRSFGGMMQRMTKASICGELRKALSASPASAASIIASMERYDCKV